MTRLKAIATLMLACAGFALPGGARADIDEMQLGASISKDSKTVSFRVYSHNATHIELCLFALPNGANAVLTRDIVAPDGDGVWSTQIPISALTNAGISTVYYGYRAWGPNWIYDSSWSPGSAAGFVSVVDSAGNRFNPNKLLLDPYAHEISSDPIGPGLPNADPTVFTSELNRDYGTQQIAPKGIVGTPAANAFGLKPTRAQKDDVIYEMNVRGMTANDDSVPQAERGTYAGAAEKAAYLQSLGVTAVELQPVQEVQNDQDDIYGATHGGAAPPNGDPGWNSGQYYKDNYWGYMTLAYFAPDRRYASNRAPGGPTAEFQAMVKAFHDVGVKVYMDVVYNHTGEGAPIPNTGPTTAYPLYGMRGLDNSAYYELAVNGQGVVNADYYGANGAGPDYNTYNHVAQNLIVDSLYYWSATMGVDGFRFDEGPMLGNVCESDQPSPQTPNCPTGTGFTFSASDAKTALARILSEPLLATRPAAGGSGLDLIAEPNAVGCSSCGNAAQQGNFPAGFSEWNFTFKEVLPKAQNKLGVVTIAPGVVADAFTGSASLFEGASHNNRSPWNSVNYMDSHDGVTLKDLYSCNGPNNNQGYPLGPSDGGSDDISWDQDNPSTGQPAAQRRAARTGLAFVMLSAGTPMIQAGDESLRTLACNDNPYDVDSVGAWLNPQSSWTSDQSNFNTYVTRAIAFRKAHPALRPATWYTPAQVVWYYSDAAQVSSDPAQNNYWNGANNYLAYMINGGDFADSTMYVIYNGASAYTGDIPANETQVILPPPPPGKTWYRVTDTCEWNDGPDAWAAPGNETLIGPGGSTYGVCGQALALFIAK
ncbi:MAG: alpha-amylase family glycosyl hydrolase [Roseiarcus sp.]|uniref:alpha-amylase family glycosyl hydrolase n=1 Tax=Roseiarcus sp. TaxID=1969460 RepID=UPI003C535921